MEGAQEEDMSFDPLCLSLVEVGYSVGLSRHREETCSSPCLVFFWPERHGSFCCLHGILIAIFELRIGDFELVVLGGVAGGDLVE